MMKLFFFLILMQILPSGLKGRNLDPPLLSMIKAANNTCVVYDFEENKIRTRKPAWSDEERRIVLQALNNHGFYFNGEKDTVLICMAYVDFLIHSYQTPFGKGGCQIPINIHAYSSQSDLNLTLGEGEEYELFASHIIGVEDRLPEIIKANDMDAFRAIYDKYHSTALGAGPDHVLRIEILENKIVSFSEWIYEIYDMNYMWVSDE